MGILKLRIQSAHPGTAVLNVDAYNDFVSSIVQNRPFTVLYVGKWFNKTIDL